MKSFLRGIVALILAFLARGILHKYRPRIVMVTGSVGKTSTKDAVAAALSPKFHLRASEKSYNSEFGVPLTIIGAKNPWTDASAWFRVIGEALALIFLPNHYPNLLVLEVGADRPGDLQKILAIAIPDAVVVTRLPEVPVHVEAYASPAAVREEEFAPAYALLPGAPLILSADDTYAKHLASRLSARVTTYGFAKDADIRLGEAEVIQENGPKGMQTRVMVGNHSYDVAARGALGRQQLYAPAAALACALALGLSAKEALKGLEDYVPPPGRAHLLRGLSDAVLIDDTYNSSPAAVEEALSSLALAPGKRRIAVLGDMLELGRYSTDEHAHVGKRAATHADVVVGVGARAESITQAARVAGKGEREALHFNDSYEAADALRDMLRPGDVVLIKGSQGMRMERIVKELIKDPRDANLLVRQDKEWLKKA